MWNHMLRLSSKESSNLTKLLLDKGNELENLAKDIEIEDIKLTGKINEFNAVRKLNDEVFNRQINEIYLSILDLKKLNEGHLKVLDPVLDSHTIGLLKENLNKINVYILNMQKQSPKDLTKVNYENLNIRYSFSKN